MACRRCQLHTEKTSIYCQQFKSGRCSKTDPLRTSPSILAVTARCRALTSSSASSASCAFEIVSLCVSLSPIICFAHACKCHSYMPIASSATSSATNSLIIFSYLKFTRGPHLAVLNEEQVCLLQLRKHLQQLARLCVLSGSCVVCAESQHSSQHKACPTAACFASCKHVVNAACAPVKYMLSSAAVSATSKASRSGRGGSFSRSASCVCMFLTSLFIAR